MNLRWLAGYFEARGSFTVNFTGPGRRYPLMLLRIWTPRGSEYGGLIAEQLREWGFSPTIPSNGAVTLNRRGEQGDFLRMIKPFIVSERKLEKIDIFLSALFAAEHGLRADVRSLASSLRA